MGSYPTFSPLPNARVKKDLPEVLPPACHRDAAANPANRTRRVSRRRSILCGTFRSPVPAIRFRSSREPNPLALPGALPIGPAPYGPGPTVSGLSSRFAALRPRNQRSPDSPATFDYSSKRAGHASPKPSHCRPGNCEGEFSHFLKEVP